jgi:hypothetical protein
MKSKIIILVFNAFLISCSYSPKRPEFIESFITHIETDGTKKFSFSLVNSRPTKSMRSKKGKSNATSPGKKGSKGRHQSKPPGPNSSMNDKPNFNEMFITKLEKILYESDYCQEGYIKLDSFFDRETSQIRGQCEEKATLEDRKHFPNHD